MLERRPDRPGATQRLVPLITWTNILNDPLPKLKVDVTIPPPEFVEAAKEELIATGNMRLVNYLEKIGEDANPLYLAETRKSQWLCAFVAHCVINEYQKQGIPVPKVTDSTFSRLYAEIAPDEKQYLRTSEKTTEEINNDNPDLAKAINLYTKVLYPRFMHDIQDQLTTFRIVTIYRAFKNQAHADALGMKFRLG